MIKKTTFIFLFIGIYHLLLADNLPEGYQVKKFMIRNASFTSEIARSFNIHPNFLKQYNKSLPKILYKGAVINVPIKLKPVEWNPERYNSNKPFLGPEDARPQNDFEWDNEMIDPLFVEEILSIDEIYADSVQFEKIKNHIGNIDTEIKAIKRINDSIKKAEFSFEYDEKDMNSVLKRMEKARNQYYAKTPNALRIDSLQQIRSKLAEETNRLRRKLSDYDYMVENAYYFNKFKEGRENLKRKRRTSADDKITYESNYLMYKDKSGKNKNTNETKVYIPAEVLVHDENKEPSTPVNKPNIEEAKKDKEDRVVKETESPTVEPTNNATKENKVTNELNDHKKSANTTSTIDKQSEVVVANPVNEMPIKSNKATSNDKVPAAPIAENTQKNTPTNAIETKVEDVEPTFENLSILEQNQTPEIESKNTAAPILYAKKIVLQDELNLDKVDAMIIDNQIKIERNEISPYKLKTIKGLPAYQTTTDSATKIKSIAYLNRFKSNLLLNDNKQAIKDLEKAIDLDPTNYKAWVFHADLLIIADTQIDAMKEYQIATELNPKNSPLFYKIARLYESSNNIGKAYEFYTRSIEADSFFANGYMGRANLSLKQNDKKAAMDDYNALINLLPNLPDPHKERGFLRLENRDYGGALVDFNDYIEVSDPNAEVIYKRGISRVYLGKIVDGCVDFAMASKLGYKDAEKASKKYCQ